MGQINHQETLRKIGTIYFIINQTLILIEILNFKYSKYLYNNAIILNLGYLQTNKRKTDNWMDGWTDKRTYEGLNRLLLRDIVVIDAAIK